MSHRKHTSKKISRRDFVDYTGTLVGLGMTGLVSNSTYFE